MYLLIMSKFRYILLDIPNCMINDHNCSQICVEVVGSFNCSCYLGYDLQEDRASCAGTYINTLINTLNVMIYVIICMYVCIDIDECVERLTLCDHNCTNTAGSYFCTCLDGYMLEMDNHTCAGNDYIFLIFTNQKLHILCILCNDITTVMIQLCVQYKNTNLF